MRSYQDVRDELVRPSLQAVEAARREFDNATRDVEARKAALDLSRAEVVEMQGRKQALQEPRVATVTRIRTLEGQATELRRQIVELERDIENRQLLLREMDAKQQELDDEVARRRAAVGKLDRELKEGLESVSVRRGEIEAAQKKVTDSQIRALRVHYDELFDFFRHYASEASAQKAWEDVSGAYERARQADPEVRHAHEARQELRELLASAQVMSVRAMLESQLTELDSRLNQRFPGLLAGPPPADPDQIYESYYWYDVEEDVTSLLLPLPVSVWHNPPEHPSDPRGAMVSRVLWAFVETLGEPVPTIECVGDFPALQFHGDETGRIAEKLIEIWVAPGRKVNIVPAMLPVELMEALQ